MSPALLSILFGILFCALLAWIGTHTLEYFSTERRAARAAGSQSRVALANALRREAIASRTLTKIAANDSGNPALEAQIALEEMNRNKLAELES